MSSTATHFGAAMCEFRRRRGDPHPKPRGRYVPRMTSSSSWSSYDTDIPCAPGSQVPKYGLSHDLFFFFLFFSFNDSLFVIVIVIVIPSAFHNEDRISQLHGAFTTWIYLAYTRPIYIYIFILGYRYTYTVPTPHLCTSILVYQYI